MSIIKYLIFVTFIQIIKPYGMEIAIIFGVFFVFYMLHNLSGYHKIGKEKDKAQEMNNQESKEQTQENKGDSMKEEQENKPDTLGLMFRTLSNIGCQPTKDDDGTIRVSYQGEKFHMEFFGRYVRIWDPMWAGIKADDPNMPNVREAVNAANYNFGTTVVLDNPDEKGIIAFHTISDIMLHPACPDNDYYVKAVLDTFFDAKEQVISNFKLINEQQMEAQKNRRPIGFTAPAAPESK